ncbi:MAG: triose-phosphate isomerase [Rubritepida sp.]|nr:triose-phosphate isomerase [Rubritepida sp.]
MTPGIRPLIAGNWKMHGSLREAVRLAEGVREGVEGVDLLVCPPFVHLHPVAVALLGSRVAVGAQDCHAAAKGAHTGDVSAAMVRDTGATHVILGHSERRQNHGEDDLAVLTKTEAALAAGLIPVVCVGETEAERLAGKAEKVVTGQLDGSIPYGFVTAGGIVAYEPVWAIGTGRTPTEEEVAAIHGTMRHALVERFGPAARTTRLLYGGSVKPGNAAGLFALADVDGALVGGASLVAADFLAIARAVPE